MIILAITVKMKIRILIVLQQFREDIEYSSKILDDKINQMHLVTGCWGFLVI